MIQGESAEFMFNYLLWQVWGKPDEFELGVRATLDRMFDTEFDEREPELFEDLLRISIAEGRGLQEDEEVPEREANKFIARQFFFRLREVVRWRKPVRRRRA